MKVKTESEVTQSRPTRSDPMDCSPPGSSIHGIFQARVLEWLAIAFSDRVSIGIPNFLTELLQQHAKVKSKTTISSFSSAPYPSDWNDY